MDTSPTRHHSAIEEICEELSGGGYPSLGAVVEKLLNAAMLIEREKFLGVQPYERNPERSGHANGFKPRTVRSRVGTLQVAVPQVRNSEEPFYPQSLSEGLRSERALTVAIAEMYVQGVSTRKVKPILEKLCGTGISSTQVSAAAKTLDDALRGFRERPLTTAYPLVYLDARYEKVRRDGQIRNAAILIAVGVNEQGYREILGVSCALSEAEVHWRTFLQSLVERGLHGVRLIISDAHEGLKKARQAVLPAVPWQRCTFHLGQNAQQYVPRRELRAEIAQAVRDIIMAPSREDALRIKESVITKYARSAGKFVEWLDTTIEESLTFFSLPRQLHKIIRTVNILENLNREIRRRTRVATIFCSEESCLRLVTAVVMETHEEWISGKRYMDLRDVCWE
jgi:transposase-like protein